MSKNEHTENTQHTDSTFALLFNKSILIKKNNESKYESELYLKTTQLIPELRRSTGATPLPH